MDKIKSKHHQEQIELKNAYVVETATNSHKLIANVGCPLKLSQKQNSTLENNKIKNLRLTQNMFSSNTYDILNANNLNR